MKIKLRTVIIVISVVFALYLVIAMPQRISYLRSDNFQYDKKCAELKKELRSEFRGDLGELTVHFYSETNTLTVSFYESGYRFDRAFECKKDIEAYVNGHPDFFVRELGSKVEVESKTDPYYDYPREMYIYKGSADKNGLILDTMQYLTDAYTLERSEFIPQLDITALVVTDYGDVNSAMFIAAASPELKSVSFTNRKRQPDDDDLEKLKEKLGADCAVILNNKD